VHLVGFITRIYHHALSPERQRGLYKSHFAVTETFMLNEFQTFISMVFNSDFCRSKTRKLSALKFVLDET